MNKQPAGSVIRRVVLCRSVSAYPKRLAVYNPMSAGVWNALSGS
ncbi:hypothetical protein [Paenibacillus lacisoli]|nr:hypothetical protein [Paenibacillus sp. JX-17]